MSQWIKRIAAVGIGSKDRAVARRRTRISNPSCDTLEDRQLLSMMGGGMRFRPDFGGGQGLDQAQVQTSVQGRGRFDAFGGATGSGGLFGSGGHGMRARRFAMRFGGGAQQSATQAPMAPTGGTTADAATTGTTSATPSTATTSAADPTASATPATPPWQQGGGPRGSVSPSSAQGGTGPQGGGQAMPFGPGNSGGMAFGRGGFDGAGPRGQLGPWGGQGSSQTAPPGQAGGQGGNATAGAADTEFQKLRTDLQAIEDKSQVTPALEAAVRKDFEKIQSTATSQPDQTEVQALSDLQKSLDGQLPTDAQKQQLQDAFTAVLKSQGISDQSLIDQTVGDLNAVQNARNITADDVSTIAADQKAIQAKLGTTDTTKAPMPLPGLSLNAFAFPGGPRSGFGGR